MDAVPAPENVVEPEQPLDMVKMKSAAAIIRGAQGFIPVSDLSGQLYQEYWDIISTEGLTEDELTYMGITADDLTSCVTLLENIDKFTEGETVTPTQYRVTINKIRRLDLTRFGR